MHRYRFKVIFSFLAIYISIIAAVLSFMGSTMTVGGTLCANPTIIIDAGHGGFDGGAEGAGGTIEKDINLPIALKLYDLLQFYGYDVLMTRKQDISTCDEGLNSISEKKTSDIMNRFKLLEKNPDAIFISIHQNKYPDSSSWGAQMFYGPKNEQSKILADTIQKNFVTMLQPDNKREVKKAEDNIYLLYHSPIPSVLVECGFLSNPDEEALLLSEDYQNKIAFVISASIMEYIQQGYFPQIQDDSSPSSTAGNQAASA